MQNNQSIMQISENKDGSAKVLFRIRKAEMTDVDEIMAVMHEAKNDKEHPTGLYLMMRNMSGHI